MNLANLLRGTEIVRDSDGLYVVQTIHNMAIAFLTCDDQYSLDDRFENPVTALHVTNRNYGHVNLNNKTDKDVIVAPQAAFMTKYAAQNHALPKSAAVPAHSNVDYHDAGCVEGAQGGRLRGDTDLRFVPLSIREMLLQEVNKTGSYSHLYSSVKALGNRTGVGTGTYIDKYYSHDFTRTAGIDLNEFIAHFERPDKTIGVIVLVDDEIIAIDKFPSFRYTAQVWDLLIRDCYGSVAIEAMQSGAPKPTYFTKTLESLTPVDGETPVQLMRRALVETRRSISNRVYDRLVELTTLEFTDERDVNSTDVYQSDVIKSEGYIGQVIRSGDYVHLVSLIKKDKFDPTSIRKVIAARHEYEELAVSQRAFSV